MDVCDPDADIKNLREQVKLDTGKDLRLTREQICGVQKNIQAGRLPLPPMLLNRSRKTLTMTDKKSPLTARDFERLFDENTTLDRMQRIARKAGLKVDNKSKADLVSGVKDRMVKLKVAEPVRITKKRILAAKAAQNKGFLSGVVNRFTTATKKNKNSANGNVNTTNANRTNNANRTTNANRTNANRTNANRTNANRTNNANRNNLGNTSRANNNVGNRNRNNGVRFPKGSIFRGQPKPAFLRGGGRRRRDVNNNTAMNMGRRRNNYNNTRRNNNNNNRPARPRERLGRVMPRNAPGFMRNRGGGGGGIISGLLGRRRKQPKMIGPMENFIPAKKFNGAKNGYVFQQGNQGLGYYPNKRRSSKNDFVQSNNVGPRNGYTFKNGPNGKGYYKIRRNNGTGGGGSGGGSMPMQQFIFGGGGGGGSGGGGGGSGGGGANANALKMNRNRLQKERNELQKKLMRNKFKSSAEKVMAKKKFNKIQAEWKAAFLKERAELQKKINNAPNAVERNKLKANLLRMSNEMKHVIGKSNAEKVAAKKKFNEELGKKNVELQEKNAALIGADRNAERNRQATNASLGELIRAITKQNAKVKNLQNNLKKANLTNEERNTLRTNLNTAMGTVREMESERKRLQEKSNENKKDAQREKQKMQTNFEKATAKLQNNKEKELNAKQAELNEAVKQAKAQGTQAAQANINKARNELAKAKQNFAEREEKLNENRNRQLAAKNENRNRQLAAKNANREEASRKQRDNIATKNSNGMARQLLNDLRNLKVKNVNALTKEKNKIWGKTNLNRNEAKKFIIKLDNAKRVALKGLNQKAKQNKTNALNRATGIAVKTRQKLKAKLKATMRFQGLGKRVMNKRVAGIKKGAAVEYGFKEGAEFGIEEGKKKAQNDFLASRLGVNIPNSNSNNNRPPIYNNSSNSNSNNNRQPPKPTMTNNPTFDPGMTQQQMNAAAIPGINAAQQNRKNKLLKKVVQQIPGLFGKYRRQWEKEIREATNMTQLNEINKKLENKMNFREKVTSKLTKNKARQYKPIMKWNDNLAKRKIQLEKDLENKAVENNKKRENRKPQNTKNNSKEANAKNVFNKQMVNRVVQGRRDALVNKAKTAMGAQWRVTLGAWEKAAGNVKTEANMKTLENKLNSKIKLHEAIITKHRGDKPRRVALIGRPGVRGGIWNFNDDVEARRKKFENKGQVNQDQANRFKKAGNQIRQNRVIGAAKAAGKKRKDGNDISQAGRAERVQMAREQRAERNRDKGMTNDEIAKLWTKPKKNFGKKNQKILEQKFKMSAKQVQAKRRREMSYVRNDNETEARAEKAKAEEVNKKAEKAKRNAERQGIARMGSAWKPSGPADEKNRGGKRSFKPNNSERPKTRRKAEGLPPGREQPPRKVKAKPQRAGGRREQPPREAKDKAAREKANTQRMIRAGIESKLRDKFTLLSNDNVSEFMKEYNKNPTGRVSRNIFRGAREKVEAKKGANLEAKKKAKANAEAAEAAEAKKKVEAKKAAAKAKAEEQRAANAAAAEAKKAEAKRAANAEAKAFNKEFKATRVKLHPNKTPNAVKNLAERAFKALGQYKNVVNKDPRKRNVAKLKGFVTQFQKAKAKRAWKKAGTKTKAVVRLKKAGANRAAARNAPRPAFAPNGRQRVAAAQRQPSPPGMRVTRAAARNANAVAAAQRQPSPPGMRVTRAAARNANDRRRAAPARTPSPPGMRETRSSTAPRRSPRVQQQGRR